MRLMTRRIRRRRPYIIRRFRGGQECMLAVGRRLGFFAGVSQWVITTNRR